MYRIIIISVISFLAFNTCEDNFNPYGVFQEEYILNCILRSDTTFQIATLSRSYMPDEADPNSFREDPAIVGADIRVWYNDSVYLFRDSSVARIDTSRYSTPIRFYYNNNFSITSFREIEIEVLLHNGRRLRASSITPATIVFKTNSEVIIPPVNLNLVQFFWEAQEQGTYFSPKFEIKYLQKINGSTELKTIEVPLRYTNNNGNLKPVYTEPSNRTSAIYTLDAVTKTLEEISDGDPNKTNYTIFQTPMFDLLAFDTHLSRYASSTSQSLNDLTVTVNASDYTNIEGGLGIFGSYTKENYPAIKFQPGFIESFGYNFIFDSK